MPEANTEILPVSFTTPEGIRLAADIAGEPWNPRLIFVHGGGQSRRSWRSALQAMAESGFSVVSYDLRGHGESDWSDVGDYDLDAHVRDLTAIVNASPHPPALVGASLGGRVALETAAKLGAVVIPSLVLVDITPKIDPRGVARISHFLEVSRKGFDNIEQAIATLEEYAERRIKNNDFHLAHSIRRDDTGRIFWRWDPKLAAPDILIPGDIEDRLTESSRRLKCPVLLVRGTKSDVVTDACVSHFLDTQPNAQIAEIQGGGHLMKSARLGEFCEATLEFLHREFG